MGFTLTTAPPTRAQENLPSREKTASRDFLVNTRKTHQENRPQPLNPQQETTPYSYKITSGRPVWPSRDPIGERGGEDLYGVINNDGVNRWDYLGLATIIIDPVDGIIDNTGTSYSRYVTVMKRISKIMVVSANIFLAFAGAYLLALAWFYSFQQSGKEDWFASLGFVLVLKPIGHVLKMLVRVCKK